MIEFRFDQTQMNRVMKMMRAFPDLPKQLFYGLTKRARTIMKSEMLSGQVLKVRTGRLRNSIQDYVTGRLSDGSLYGIVGSGVRTGNRVKYANIHATGGVIRPKRSKYLAIPLKDALTPSGGGLRGGALSAREFLSAIPKVEIRIFRSKAGNLIIARKRGSRGMMQLLFVLKRSVYIPKRDYITPTGDRVLAEMPKITKEAIRKVVFS